MRPVWVSMRPSSATIQDYLFDSSANELQLITLKMTKRLMMFLLLDDMTVSDITELLISWQYQLHMRIVGELCGFVIIIHEHQWY